MTNGFDEVIERYGPPHLWTTWEWFCNLWRLFGEHVEIRVFIDVALRCPDPELAKMARDKFGAEFDIEHLDTDWPGKGHFTYDWEGLTKLREAKEKDSDDEDHRRDDAG